jgi:hypothetical protein
VIRGKVKSLLLILSLLLSQTTTQKKPFQLDQRFEREIKKKFTGFGALGLKKKTKKKKKKKTWESRAKKEREKER